MLLNAHIFKRRSRGDREEVKIKLFNPDGSDYEGGSGEGGGATGEKMLFIGYTFVPVMTDSEFIRPEFGNQSPSYSEGFDFPPFNEGLAELPLPQGGYLIRIEPSWGWSVAPESGYTQVNAQLVDAEGFDAGSVGYSTEQFGPQPDTPPSMQMFYVAQEGMHLELEAGQGGTEQTPDLTLRVELYKL